MREYIVGFEVGVEAVVVVVDNCDTTRKVMRDYEHEWVGLYQCGIMCFVGIYWYSDNGYMAST